MGPYLDFAVTQVRHPDEGRAQLGAAKAEHTHAKAEITDFPAFGTDPGTICQGDDARLSDSRTPNTHGSGKHDGTVEARSAKGVANGYCELDSSALVPAERLPAVAAAGVVPIGAVIAWLQDLAGVPALPEEFALCDGSVVADADSPLNGQTLPDLNSTNTFLRGNATSGGTGGAATHIHEYGVTDGASALPDGGGSVFGWSVGDPQGTDPADTIPPYMDVVWIIRIK
jgi:hypothetical protein